MRRIGASITAALAVFALAGGSALAKRPDQSGKPDKPGKPDRSSYGKARGPLVRATNGPDDHAKGRIDIQSRRNGSDFRVIGQRLAPETAVDIVIKRLGDDPVTLDVVETDAVVALEVLVDNTSTNGDGAVKAMFRTHKGDVLPLGAASLAELVGTRVCIREEASANDGADLLVGTVPAIGSDYPKRLRRRVELVRDDETDTCAGKLRLRFRGKDVRSELQIDIKGLAEGDAVSFRMDDGAGNLVEIGSATANGDGEARYRVRTHHGDSLPFGALTILDLAGRAVEVWVNPAFVDPTPEILDDALVEEGRCLTGAIPTNE